MSEQPPASQSDAKGGNDKKAKAATLVDMVEKEIYKYIRDNDLEPGDALPKELELAERFQVSRSIVREALGKLRFIGLVESKKRKGMTLAQPDVFRGLDTILNAAAVPGDTVNELLEFRFIIETGMSHLIFARRDTHHIGILEEMVAREDEYPNDRKIRSECDIKFHSTLYEMAGNGLIKRFQDILALYFERSESQLPLQFHGQPGFKSHKDLLEIIKTGTPEMYCSAMRKHLQLSMGHFGISIGQGE